MVSEPTNHLTYLIGSGDVSIPVVAATNSHAPG